MGLLTNIFVAPTDAPPDAEEESEPGMGVQLKSVTSLNLSTLWAIIEAVPRSASVGPSGARTRVPGRAAYALR